MTANNLYKGKKVVWLDESGAQFVGTVVSQDEQKVTVDFKGYPAWGLLEGTSETKTVRSSELQAAQGNEEEILWQAKFRATKISKCITEACTENGDPLEGVQQVIVFNAIAHGLFNELIKQN